MEQSDQPTMDHLADKTEEIPEPDTQSSNAEVAGSVFERLLPELTQREIIAQIFTASIKEAEQHSDDKWGITVPKSRDYIRLNIGNLVLFTIYNDSIALSVDLNVLDPSTLSHLRKDGVQVRKHTFNSMPEGGIVFLAASVFSKAMDVFVRIQVAHRDFIKRAATRAKHHPRSLQQIHASGLIDYLETYLGEELPSPAYASAIPDVDRATIETALRQFDAVSRSAAEWIDWERNNNYEYAILWNGDRYPLKEIVRQASGVITFKSNQARSYLTKRGFEIVRLRTESMRNIWLLQANPKKYDLATDLRKMSVGGTDWWGLTANRKQMRNGDTVILWQSGSSSGMYALGEVISDPYQHTEQGFSAAGSLPSTTNAPWRINYRYTRILEQPIYRQQLEQHPLLQHLPMFKFRNAGSYRIEEDQWEAIQALIDSTPKNLSDILLTVFAAEGLAFTPWQIATFYTALQTKGFVILSGISGTGKTKLAQHFAGLLPQPMATSFQDNSRAYAFSRSRCWHDTALLW